MKKKKPINNYIAKHSKVCDRCGNDLYNGTFLIHLPYSKKYITLCSICQFGLIWGYYKDFIRETKSEVIKS